MISPAEKLQHQLRQTFGGISENPPPRPSSRPMGEKVSAERVGFDWENPRLRCGVALAGANHFTNSFFDRAGSPLRAASTSASNGSHGVTRPTEELGPVVRTGLYQEARY